MEIRATAESQHHDETLKKLKNLNDENFLLKKKSVELFETVQILRSRNEELKDENKKLEETIQDLKNIFKIRKILSMSEIFQKLFKPNANDKTLVTLSSEYPNFFNPVLKIKALVACGRHYLCSFLIHNLGFSKTAKQFKRDFSNIINPVLDMISKQDSNFNVTALNSTLN
ncbi:hypothetical protein BpHYR1_025363 [Brachionus plicatilis]|uniref:Uncharacterized protein n=1 Tax=Brachionus plicatilis TaxID=10195 RepID=A0A3M7PPD8_BRAPC|nr:hypothetical protein BpHYR1_025363 [Brachionus plicatilis]